MNLAVYVCDSQQFVHVLQKADSFFGMNNVLLCIEVLSLSLSEMNNIMFCICAFSLFNTHRQTYTPYATFCAEFVVDGYICVSYLNTSMNKEMHISLIDGFISFENMPSEWLLSHMVVWFVV